MTKAQKALPRSQKHASITGRVNVVCLECDWTHDGKGRSPRALNSRAMRVGAIHSIVFKHAIRFGMRIEPVRS